MTRNESQHSDVCGLHFSKIELTDLLHSLERRIETDRIRLSLAATDSVVLAARDAELRRVLNSFDYLLADGSPIVWASRLLGSPLPERIAGPELFERLLELCRCKGYSAFFFGSDEDTVRLVRQRIPAGVRVAGHLCPEIRQSFDRAESTKMISEINRAEPDFLFVVLGAPKQDRWIHENGDGLHAKLIVPIGAAFDCYAGRFVRAPRWMQHCGLEWVGRLVQDPRRLWRRYVRDLVFPFLVLRHWARSSSGENRSAPSDAC